MKYTAKLDDWTFWQVTSKDAVLIGKCYEDSKGRFPDGCYIRTSKVPPRKYKEGDIVETLDSTYLLGVPSDD